MGPRELVCGGAGGACCGGKNGLRNCWDNIISHGVVVWMAAPSMAVASTGDWQRGQLLVEVGLVELVGVGAPSCKEPTSPCQHTCNSCLRRVFRQLTKQVICHTVDKVVFV